MNTLFRIEDMLKALSDAVSSTGLKVFPTTRPDSVPGKMMEFAVVSVPTTIHNMTYGLDYGWNLGTCSVEIFVRDKGGLENVSRLSKLVNDVASLFPVSFNDILASRPSLVMSGSDGYGFHVATLNATIQTI